MTRTFLEGRAHVVDVLTLARYAITRFRDLLFEFSLTGAPPQCWRLEVPVHHPFLRYDTELDQWTVSRIGVAFDV